ncbi:hypothetical protein [Phyllobacterium sp. K27]
MFHGYFTKYLEWSYEQEVRAVNFENYTEDVNGNKILYVSKKCIATIVSGAKSSEQTRQSLQEAATDLDSEFYLEKIGRSYPTPYLITDTENSRVFAKGEIAVPDGVCGECYEPLRTKGDLCPWCSIDETDKMTAAANNPFRILDNYGLLEQYMKKFPNRPRNPYK